ncbi:MAG TPA: FHA domain-containing protein [Bellilinea sp.]|nr:FHA domain-containing protein [Bellilinea sp.]
MHSIRRIRPGRTISILISLIILGVVIPFKHVSAQESSGKVVLAGIGSDSFPTLSVEFEAYDASAGFLTDLEASQVAILENGLPQPISNLELLQPGVQLTLAFNLSPELSNSYAGVTRMANILERLQQWAQRQPAETADQVSLATNTGLQLIRSGAAAEWEAAFFALATVDLKAEKSSLTALTRAVDLATDPSAERVMKNAILYITPLPGAASLAALPNLAERASGQNTPIYVWLVASASAPTSSPELFQPLEDLALQSGGALFLYSGVEALPDPDGYLNPLRYLYRASYDSKIQASGSYDIHLEIKHNDQQLISESRPVFVNVLPPNPIFLSPPSKIDRTWQPSDQSGDEVLLPARVELQIVVEFSDGHQRPLKATRLFVDGQLAAENTQEPFDTFQWDLSNFQADARHVLNVEVEDTLGLIRRSIDTPVDLTVEPAKANVIKSLLSSDHLLIFGGVLAAGVVLVLALGLVGRRAHRESPASRRAREDPLTQPVTSRMDNDKPTTTPTIDRPSWPRYAVGSLSSAPAWLLRVPDTGGLGVTASQSNISPSSNPASAIPLSRRETKLGSDPQVVTYKISSPTVSPLHARVLQTAEGGFLIQDSGSVAGTWVNYSPVPAQGLLLRHGDLVQIGKIAFRFELANPPEERQPRISNRQEPT